MNTTYHLSAPTYEEYKRILQEMLNSEDAALCCASVIWRPSGLADYYKSKGWDKTNEPLGKIYKNLGLQKASEMFYNLTSKGTSEDDAWLAVYSRECSLDKEVVA